MCRDFMQNTQHRVHCLRGCQDSDKYHAPVWTHNSETEREVAECKARWGMTPMQFTESLGLYEHGGGGYHCVWLEEKDIEILKKHHMSVVTNPGSNTKLASGICPVKRLLDEGSILQSVRMDRRATTVWTCSGRCFCDRTGKTQGTGRFLHAGRGGALYGDRRRRICDGTAGL